MADDKAPPGTGITRRELLNLCVRGCGVLAATGLVGVTIARGSSDQMVWQIDPHKCSQCGRCATACVLKPSAVKCMHEYSMCGYCELCFGYFVDQRADDTIAAENQRCPTDAIHRGFVEDPYFQYAIDEDKCIGCGICVKGCNAFGNGSMLLQVKHDRCLNCNECAIARVCPAQAFVRVPASRPYLLRREPEKS
jgi:electron transport complex protein RnfB